MTHRKNVPFPAQNQHCRVSKNRQKRPHFLHLTHEMTHGLTHHLGHNFSSFSVLVKMAVMANMLGLFNKNYSTRFLPLSPSMIKAGQMTAYKMAELIGMAHSLSLYSSTN